MIVWFLLIILSIHVLRYDSSTIALFSLDVVIFFPLWILPTTFKSLGAGCPLGGLLRCCDQLPVRVGGQDKVFRICYTVALMKSYTPCHDAVNVDVRFSAMRSQSCDGLKIYGWFCGATAK